MLFAASEAARSRSITARVEISDVSFSSTVQMLAKPGSATRNSCGSLTRKKMWRRCRPSDAAASAWPRGTAPSAAIQTSLEYAAVTTASAITPAKKAFTSRWVVRPRTVLSRSIRVCRPK